jgi:hypothetical protein
VPELPTSVAVAIWLVASILLVAIVLVGMPYEVVYAGRRE